MASIDPQRLTLGLRAEAAQWTAQLGLNYTQGKKAKDTTALATGAQFLNPSATVVDLTVSPPEIARLGAGDPEPFE